MKYPKNIYTKLLGFLIKKGKKSLAKKTLNSSLARASLDLKISIFAMAKKIFQLTNSYVSSKSIKIRKKNHLVPFFLNSERRSFVSANLLVSSAKELKDKLSLEDKLIKEVINLIIGKKSKILKKKRIINKEVLKSRSNLHYR